MPSPTGDRLRDVGRGLRGRVGVCRTWPTEVELLDDGEVKVSATL